MSLRMLFRKYKMKLKCLAKIAVIMSVVATPVWIYRRGVETNAYEFENEEGRVSLGPVKPLLVICLGVFFLLCFCVFCICDLTRRACSKRSVSKNPVQPSRFDPRAPVHYLPPSEVFFQPPGISNPSIIHLECGEDERYDVYYDYSIV